ncbi:MULTISPECIES: hypothetical protein [unclassified Polaromonas]|jgi:hypothetical protein|uniref:hypothetical protein n=2 Tax=unclassified Polaromonas TaxID=2638319 RepID=UPI000BD5C305|nr:MULTISPECIES: hypothetical protein [unclassified Polaromonas]OYZ19723.1 MAG: hypothetical protein B7Y28_10585 [Polaromonas sp. 16-63-31]OYY35973.1 MAG: hypothetical protein B7Y60_12555 [Polaromonas sp. 35-63-35]OYZ80011.1 MAG: hypothetical protein B7Y09_06580 [Polaromonas sp. 24-63-21]OZA52128.1 MAG: hypothetical protein B7X88_05405 [Polaromonas sp. 17-63-33]OZA87840.1 MAG: hypothetical protein B7X65_10040 [Polaromonas sp. 39-63-25]
MMNDNTVLSPRERLDKSRQAIVRQMGHDNATAVEHGGSDTEIDASASTWSLVKQTASSWWHGHPASLALDFARPRMQRFAQEQPLKLLAISAGMGAAAVLLRPWRLISLTGLVLAALKSSEVTGLASSLLASGTRNDRFR